MENEYGDYVDKDNEHLPWLSDLMKELGLHELFFISDGGHTIRKANMLKVIKWFKKMIFNSNFRKRKKKLPKASFSAVTKCPKIS